MIIIIIIIVLSISLLSFIQLFNICINWQTFTLHLLRTDVEHWLFWYVKIWDPLYKAFFQRQMTKISDKSVDNQSEARISVAYITKKLSFVTDDTPPVFFLFLQLGQSCVLLCFQGQDGTDQRPVWDYGRGFLRLPWQGLRKVCIFRAHPSAS